MTIASPLRFAAAQDLAWPAINYETKPWTRWWWHGSAVTKHDLTVELEKLAAAGLGGVEITPIYGIRGGEADFIHYLSPQWMDMLEHVLREARRLDLGVDMATGNGWPFGGPWVDADAACKNLVWQTYELAPGATLEEPIRHVQRPMVRAIGRRVNIADLKEAIAENNDLQGLALEQVRWEKPLPLVALIAYAPDGRATNVTSHVDANGHLNWSPPQRAGSSPTPASTASPPPAAQAKPYTLYALFQGHHGKMVERAGPGGEGNVIDHFDHASLDAYLKKFDEAFAGRDLTGLRAFFNDSYEVDDASGNADWSPRLLAEFQRRRGYDLLDHLPALFGKASDEENARVLCDYRETISDLLLDEFTGPWTEWTHRHKTITRNQAHGSPANILDLYAASDIPETEATDRIQFMSAASAAHVTGKRLVSAEACTWLDEHFVGTLAEAKRWVDAYFLGGVNHICYHGTCYSPESEAWPGRLFYASLELLPTNPQWRHFHALNSYVARCQSFLQAGKPDSDILVYYPIHDEWAKRGRTTLAHFNGEMRGTSVRQTAEYLIEAGYLFDFISDRQLSEVQVVDGKLQINGVTYHALLIPGCKSIPTATMSTLAELARSGATVASMGQLPTESAGWSPDAESDHEFSQSLLSLQEHLVDVKRTGYEGLGEFSLERARLDSDVRYGDWTDLDFIRRRLDDGMVYFLVNSSKHPFDFQVRLHADARSVVRFDPLTGDRELVKSHAVSGETFLDVSLAAGESCFLRTFDHPVSGKAIEAEQRDGEKHVISGRWSLTFVDGGPALPPAHELPEPTLWTDLPSDDVKNFSGTGRYAIAFAAPKAQADAWLLNLGEVHESAEVRLNGESVATLFAKPFSFRIPAEKLRPHNTLQIDVANLMANRIADLDRRGVAWKRFYNVNFAPRRGENRGPGGVFTAAAWKPLPSGLAGPVTLTPLRLRDRISDEPGTK